VQAAVNNGRRRHRSSDHGVRSLPGNVTGLTCCFVWQVRGSKYAVRRHRYLSGDGRQVIFPGRRLRRYGRPRVCCQLPLLARAPAVTSVRPWPARTWIRDRAPQTTSEYDADSCKPTLIGWVKVRPLIMHNRGSVSRAAHAWPHTDCSFGCRTGGHAGDRVAVPIGGYACARIDIPQAAGATFSDGLPSSLQARTAGSIIRWRSVLCGAAGSGGPVCAA
jgi:hypothetical protein